MQNANLQKMLFSLSELALAIATELGGETVAATPELKTIPKIAPIAPTLEGASTTQAEDGNTETNIQTGNAVVEVELDDEGYPWDERIHTDKKTKMQSKLVTGGKMWKLKRGTDPELAKSVRAESKLAADPAEIKKPVVPAPKSKVVPAAGKKLPVPKGKVVPAPKVDNNKAIRLECIAVINRAVNEYGVEYDDLLAVLKTEFDCASFEELVDDQYKPLLVSLTKIVEQYDAINTMNKEIYAWGGDEHAETIDAGLLSFYAELGKTKLGEVHYSDLETIYEEISEYHIGWAEFAGES